MKPVVGELILTLSVVRVYSVSVGAVGGVWLTEDREPWASLYLLLHREQLPSLNTAAADKADSKVVIKNRAKALSTISPVHTDKTSMGPMLACWYDSNKKIKKIFFFF